MQQADEDDFEKWEALVLHASGLEGGVTRHSSPHVLEFVRMVFDCFLAKFPLFFGYWKKYADLEFSIGNTETVEMVYERGVSCIPCSVDLWMHYCSFKMDTCHNPDIVRELFERGAQFVGMDFQGHPFWDKYIEFENRVEEPSRVTKILTRAVHIPMYFFSRYYSKLQQLIHQRPVEELVSAEILDGLVTELNNASGGIQMPALEFDRALRAKVDEYYFGINHHTSTETMKRWEFEGRIKRAYFHVGDLEPEDLSNWRKYLDFEEGQGDYHRTAFLYERCLVTCALYEEFWLRYARWMFAQGKDEDTRIIYAKASSILVPIANTTIRLHWARFEEKLGRFSVARDVHLAILDQLPNHVPTFLSLANLERRQRGNDAAIKLLEDHIHQQDINVAGQLAAEQARILAQCKGSVDEARQLFQDRSAAYATSQNYWISYLQFEILQKSPKESDEAAHSRVKAVYELMRTKAQFAPDVMSELSQYYMEYLLEHGDKDAAEEYMKLDKEVYGYVLFTANAYPSPPRPSSPSRKPHFANSARNFGITGSSVQCSKPSVIQVRKITDRSRDPGFSLNLPCSTS
ncbi:pre-mRNA-processing factor 39 [Lojkania enalia]|uniref:Pre-mRNA-processing factor 39 n=1 Tax=Lojkania enalia TaxID=147567 RepID=A0A9P4N557_9PLEO|nr:pre-mRNA-processing factor 39 [Didymosphaeria enalia]